MELLKLSKRILALIVQFVTGFNNMNHHTQRKVGRAQLPTCRLCDEGDETGWHLATECEKVDSSLQFNPDHDWSVDQLVALVTAPAITHLLEVRGVTD